MSAASTPAARTHTTPAPLPQAPAPAPARATTPDDVRRRNRAAMLRYLYGRERVTRQELAANLGLSLPTVTQNLHAMLEEGLAMPGDALSSTGGRRARGYAFNPRHRLAVGAQAGPTTLLLRAVDLYGNVVMERVRSLPYRADVAYRQRVGGIVGEFAAECGAVIGAGVCLPDAAGAGAEHRPDHARTPAAQSPAARTPAAQPFAVQSSPAQQPPISQPSAAQSVAVAFARHSPAPCATVRPPQAAAFAELWHDRTLRNALCIYLDRRPSGAMIVNDSVLPGCAIEHMTLVPGGRECRCGRRGCMDAYCSLETLPEDYESIPGFFSVLEQGETHHRERMNRWLDHVALAIANARSVVPGDVIVGGEAAQYLDDADIAALTRRVADLDAQSVGGHADANVMNDDAYGTGADANTGADAHGTGGTGPALTLRTASCDDGACATGAALRFVRPYLDGLFGV
ncbi:NagC family transcriptional regulator [Bifidobacterium sp. DSM 109958]|uniref:NagC family transcriptional regulator n=1 Tax=Bifidobacterium moraviense TaxID=2675323 RepID=A0A7Y0HZ09_9BIFI|nr:ROK family transcriptional regulator [Bifidobacterium sp. DSM 109958]NMN00294.1 NagC family transcriptional regulator [Bifidobacterium sp. DSM 109958]